MNKGIIAIAESIYLNKYDYMGLVFQHFRPYRIERDYRRNGEIVIWGESTMFEKLDEGETIPHYSVAFTKRLDGTSTFLFTRLH